MVAAKHDKRAVRRLEFDHKAVVELTRIAWRRAGIKDVARDDNRIHLMRYRRLQQPVEKSFVFGGTAFGVKILSKMPV